MNYKNLKFLISFIFAINLTGFFCAECPDPYESCKTKLKDDMLNIHIVPHTHDDVGWDIENNNL